MSSVQVIRNSREPQVLQLYAEGLECSVAALSGSTTSTWWLPLDLARRLLRDLGSTLGQIERNGS